MKLLITTIALLISIASIVLGQTDCSKNIYFHKDEYTGHEYTSTSLIKVIDQTGKHLLNELFNSNDRVADWYLKLYLLHENNKYQVVLQHYSFGKYASRVQYAFIKFDDDSVLKLTNPFSTKEVEDGPHTSYINTFFTITEHDLKNLTEKTIKKIKASFEYQPREPQAEVELDSKKSALIKDLALCFAQKAPKIKETGIEQKTEKANIPIQPTNEKNIDVIKPSGDTTAVSIYKSWKLAVNLNKEGIPMKMTGVQLSQFYKDGTYKSHMIMDNGTITETKGKFQLISDNKIIVFTTENGFSSPASITKLTNKELEFKGEDYSSIFIVY